MPFFAPIFFSDIRPNREMFFYLLPCLGPKGFFLIIDRLNETLGDRIKRWTKASKRNSSLSSTNAVVSTIVDSVKGLVGLGKATTPMTRSVSNGNDGSQSSMGSSDDKGIGGVDRSILEDQLDVGLQISSALMYLHEKGIMFRDLKPANVGFDGEFTYRCVHCIFFNCGPS
jgi:hypothetical protein